MHLFYTDDVVSEIDASMGDRNEVDDFYVKDDDGNLVLLTLFFGRCNCLLSIINGHTLFNRACIFNFYCKNFLDFLILNA